MCSTHMPTDIASMQACFVNMCECAHFFRLLAIPMFGQGDSPPYLSVSGLSAGLSQSVGAENRNCFVKCLLFLLLVLQNIHLAYANGTCGDVVGGGR